MRVDNQNTFVSILTDQITNKQFGCFDILMNHRFDVNSVALLPITIKNLSEYFAIN